MIIKNKNVCWPFCVKLALGLAAVLPMSADHAHATGVPAEETLTLRATIPAVCRFLQGFGGNFDITIADSQPLPMEQTVSQTAQIACNAPATLELESLRGAIAHDAVYEGDEDEPGGSILWSFDYIARLKQDGSEILQINTEDGNPPGTKVVNALDPAFDTSEAINLELTIQPEDVNGTGVLKQGDYSDWLYVRVIPQ